MNDTTQSAENAPRGMTPEEVEIETVAGWAARRKEAIGTRAGFTESPEFWRGYEAALDDVAILATRRRQRLYRSATEPQRK